MSGKVFLMKSFIYMIIGFSLSLVIIAIMAIYFEWNKRRNYLYAFCLDFIICYLVFFSIRKYQITKDEQDEDGEELNEKEDTKKE